MKYPIEYFELTSNFALKVKEIRSITLDEALTYYTDIKRRFNASGDLSVNNPVIRDFLDNYLDPNNIAESMCNYHIHRKKVAPKDNKSKVYFGAFTYDYSEETNVLQLHTSVDAVQPGEYSAFSIKNYDKSYNDLKDLFSYVHNNIPGAKEFFCYSWIVSIEAFRRLFFTGFGKDNTEVFWNFTGQSIWGQFLNKYQEVKNDKVSEFLRCIRTKDNLIDLLECFEHKPLRCSYPIKKFYEYYGV